MTKKKELPTGIINPFTDKFLETWNLWKDFKKEEFNFQYKGVISEQVALMNLNNLSGKNEDMAVQIIYQSIGEKWKGLFELTNKYKNNGAGKQGTSNNGQVDLRNSVNEEFNKRYGNR